MKLLVLALVCLCILLYFSLGNAIPLIHMPSSRPPKYRSPPDYYSDTIAIQGVFSKTIEPMENEPKLTGTILSKLRADHGVLSDQRLDVQPSGPVPSGSDSSLDNQKSQGLMDVFHKNQPQNGSFMDKIRKNQDGSFMDKIRKNQDESVDTKSQPVAPLDTFRKNRSEPSLVDTFRKKHPNPLLDTEPNTESTGLSTYPPTQSPHDWKEEINCANTPYGCCDDGVTIKTSAGCPSLSPAAPAAPAAAAAPAPAPAPAPSGCMGSQYGCCPDNTTIKNADGSNCASYPPASPTIYILPIQGSTPDAPSSCTQSAPVQSASNAMPQSASNAMPQSASNAMPAQSNMPYSSSFQPSPVNTPFNMPYQPSPVQPSASHMDTVFLSPPHQPYTPQCPKPQPCPPCGRCPEPSFECKKVPNYSSDSNVLPVPVLTDFSQFGM